MCGRFALYDYLAVFREAFDIRGVKFDFASYNVTPSMEVPVILKGESFESERMRWGFDPNFKGREDLKFINCRNETCEVRTSFKKSINNLCVVPANGFYEWKNSSTGKIPYYIQGKNDLLYFAGIYSKSESNRKTFAILTRDSLGGMEDIHHRMPLFLNKKDIDKWLDKGISYKRKIEIIFKNKIHEGLNINQVSKYVNSLKNDDKNCIKPSIEIQMELF